MLHYFEKEEQAQKKQAGMFSVLLKMKLWIGGRILALDSAIQIVASQSAALDQRLQTERPRAPAYYYIGRLLSRCQLRVQWAVDLVC